MNEEARAAPPEFPARFFWLAFAWAWVFWAIPLATTRGWLTAPSLDGLRIPLLVMGAYGPTVAAFALSFRQGNARALFGRALRWRMPPYVLMAVLFLSPVLAGIAMWIHSRQGGPALAFNLAWSDLPVLVFFLFFLGGSFNEEFGWAYAIDHIQPRRGIVGGSLLLGVIWACWHLPLFFMPTQSQFHMPFWTLLVTCCSLRLLYVWAYQQARQSILVTLLFHTSTNLTLNLFAILNPGVSATEQAAWMYYVAMLAVVAVALAFSYVFRPVACSARAM
jgi:membrane protease YdiL (CAAX protease family)